MTEKPAFIATMTFIETEAYCTSINCALDSIQAGNDFNIDDHQTFFIELGGQREISLFATDIEAATVAFNKVAKALRAITVENIRPLTWSNGEKS